MNIEQAKAYTRKRMVNDLCCDMPQRRVVFMPPYHPFGQRGPFKHQFPALLCANCSDESGVQSVGGLRSWIWEQLFAWAWDGRSELAEGAWIDPPLREQRA